MKIIHNTRDLKYRSPFGAQKCESNVRLSVDIISDEIVDDVSLCYYYGLDSFESGRMYMNSEADDIKRYGCDIMMPAEPCLFFYWIEVNAAGQVFSIGKAELSKDRRIVNGGFQITVYDKFFTTPEWMKEAVMYQIFPDRFARDSGFSVEKMMSSGDPDERIFHENWNDEVDFNGKDDQGYKALDFFGGSLDGIRENINHIIDLGVTVIYLNPVFQSRSNHRYDTGNYEEIDPMLGGIKAFNRLLEVCKENGIRLVLDGVFSHTGADSKYFNKYNRYPEIGAYQDAEGKGQSEWYCWYDFSTIHGKIYYDSWWNFPDLPNVNENDLGYRKFILGENGVVRKWIGEGSSGWRLDVSDELPDGFLRHLRASTKSQDPDALIMGEVWEDASNKISYGGYRDFLLGRTHDCVMGYPFRRTLFDWLKGKIDSSQAMNGFETIRENYPIEAYVCNMNLISSHDVARAITELAGEPDRGSRDWQSSVKLTTDQRKYGNSLLKLAMFVQFTFPGVPSVYYGDELAMEGYGDPFCRRTFDMTRVLKEPPEIFLWLKAVSKFRHEHANVSSGHIKFHNSVPDLLLYSRYSVNDQNITGRPSDDRNEYIIAVNRSYNTLSFSIGGNSYELSGLSGVIVSNGKRVFEA
ncbi:MAG: glycoside hydrolase family 13 protein [Eubacteriales bacterium]|nr:glycoside hydrolase family 13 protein [Eubacteriales bacterium]